MNQKTRERERERGLEKERVREREKMFALIDKASNIYLQNGSHACFSYILLINRRIRLSIAVHAAELSLTVYTIICCKTKL